MSDEFDRPPLMADAFARRRALEADDEAKDADAMGRAPRRPTPMVNERQAAQWAGMAALVLALGAIFAVSIFGGSAPETSERPAPPAVEQAPRFAPPTVAPAQESAPAPAAEPTPAPLPTGYIVGTEPAPVQLAPAAPQAAPVYVAPAPVADPWANASDLTPLEDEDNRGSMPKPCTHPRCEP
jgi:type IV secretory pathway VirB10-like protein